MSRTPLLVAVLAAATAVAVAAVAGLTAGGDAPGQAPARDAAGPQPARDAAGRASAAATAPVVVVISVDGLNQDAFARLPNGSTRHFRALREHGTSTSEARSAVEQTDTLPNHTGMLTGRPIGGPTGHHVTFNEDRPGLTLAEVHGSYLAGIFDVAHDNGLTTALYTSKSKFGFLDRSWDDEHGAPDRTGEDDGRDKIDSFVRADPADAAAAVLRDLSSSTPKNLNFWHVSLPDEAGHSHGFMSRPYLRAVAASDRLLGRLLAVLRADPDLQARTSVLLTADHGGGGPSHRDATELVNARVPFYAWGRGVTRGVRLYAANPDRRHPGGRVPGHPGAQPIRNFDVANTALRLLDLPALPGASAALDTTG